MSVAVFTSYGQSTIQHKTLVGENFGGVGTARKLVEKTLVIDHINCLLFWLMKP